MLSTMDYIVCDPRGLHRERSPRLFVFDENLELIAQSRDAAKRLPESVKSAVYNTLRARDSRHHRVEQTAMITPTLCARIVDLEGEKSHCTAVVLLDVDVSTGTVQ